MKLLKFDTAKKVALIKELKNQVEGMNLVQAKKFVESAPAVVKSDISKVREWPDLVEFVWNLVTKLTESGHSTNRDRVIFDTDFENDLVSDLRKSKQKEEIST